MNRALQRVKPISMSEEQRKNREERDKCLDPVTGMEYFFLNYFTIDGRKPTLRHADRALFRKYQEACKQERTLEIKRSRSIHDPWIMGTQDYADNDIYTHPKLPKESFFMPTVSGSLIYFCNIVYADGDDVIFHSTASIVSTDNPNGFKVGDTFIGRESGMWYECFKIEENSRLGFPDIYALRVTNRMGNTGDGEMQDALKKEISVYQYKGSDEAWRFTNNWKMESDGRD